MRREALDFLKRLVETPSPSGFEQPAQKLVRQQMADIAAEVSTDVHGNVIGVLNPDAELRVMLAGHVDEIGMMVTHISGKGYIHCSAIGGVDVTLVPGQRVHVHNQRGLTVGVVGKKAIHLLTEEERKRSPRLRDLWIDIGAKDRKDALKAAAVGDPITFAVPFERLRNDVVVCHGFDDKAGSFVVVETLRRLRGKRFKVAVHGVSTVQEELGLRGARTSAYHIDPQIGIAIDVTHASDFPGVEAKELGEVSLGKGPVLHRGANINPVVGELLTKTARRKRIPTQMQAAPRATGTDANAIQITRSGVAAGLVSIPNRYMHTPVEVVSLKDLDNTSRLLAEFILALDPSIDLTP